MCNLSFYFSFWLIVVVEFEVWSLLSGRKSLWGLCFVSANFAPFHTAQSINKPLLEKKRRRFYSERLLLNFVVWFVFIIPSLSCDATNHSGQIRISQKSSPYFFTNGDTLSFVWFSAVSSVYADVCFFHFHPLLFWIQRNGWFFLVVVFVTLLLCFYILSFFQCSLWNLVGYYG